MVRRLKCMASLAFFSKGILNGPRTLAEACYGDGASPSVGVGAPGNKALVTRTPQL